MSNETVHQASQKQFLDIIATLIGAIPPLSFSEAQGAIGNKGALTSSVRNSFRQFQKKQIPGAWAVVTIGGDTKETILEKLKDRRVKMWAKSMIENPDFVPLPKSTTIGLVMKSVADLGFTQEPIIEEIFEKAEELGFSLCHPEVGTRMWIDNDCADGSYHVAMNPIKDCDGHPCIFSLSFANEATQKLKGMYHWLNNGNGLKCKWGLDSKIIFSMPME